MQTANEYIHMAKKKIVEYCKNMSVFRQFKLSYKVFGAKICPHFSHVKLKICCITLYPSKECSHGQ